MKKGKLRILSDGGLFWFCPACNAWHGGTSWSFNGDYEMPTFTPSFLVRSGHYILGQEEKDCWCKYNKEHFENPSPFSCAICHTFVKDGRIEYLSDCTHSFTGTTINMIEEKEKLNEGD